MSEYKLKINDRNEEISLSSGKLISLLESRIPFGDDLYNQIKEGSSYFIDCEGKLLPSEIGFLDIESLLFPNLSVRENLSFSLKKQIKKEKELSKRIEEVALEFALRGKLDSKVKDLSMKEKGLLLILKMELMDKKIFISKNILTSFYSEIDFDKALIEYIRNNDVLLLNITSSIAEGLTISDLIGVNLYDDFELREPLKLLLSPRKEKSAIALYKGMINVIPFSKEEDSIVILGTAIKLSSKEDGDVLIRYDKASLSSQGEFEGVVLMQEEDGLTHIEISKQEVSFYFSEPLETEKRVSFDIDFEDAIFFSKKKERISVNIVSEERNAIS